MIPTALPGQHVFKLVEKSIVFNVSSAVSQGGQVNLRAMQILHPITCMVLPFNPLEDLIMLKRGNDFTAVNSDG